ncbi:uncharacterized protein LOC131425957 [Malaya genurostris]|uniref:uncharacterized protein LOC131425957 n=1 Tax=Malaya genurostris TaxID=325434 RepID=UPI0026F3873E|nr:uncharacterized protein LOC131425957 [Malaya genurostris]
MEASDTPAPVVPSSPAFISRPGPVGGCGEGGFQTFLHGKYLSFPSYACADSFSGSSSMTSTHRTLGRNAVGIMEASDPLATVVPSQPALVSRPGPVCESGEEVFQPVAAGKYTSNLHNSTIDCLPASSSNLHRLPALRNVLKIHVCYQNAGGMNSCLENYRLACSDDCFDIIALTETWLTENTLSIQAFDSNYEVFRTDRSSRNSNKIIGGGVLVAIRRRLKAQLLQNASENNVEQVCVKISLNDSSSLFLCVVYLPPDRIRDLSLIDTHIQSIDEITSVHMRPSDEILIIGDFNFPGLKWIPASDGFLYVDPLHSSFHTGITNLLDRYSLNLLRQVNHVQNENGRILDLCFSSQSDCAPRIIAAPFPLVKSVRHHPPLHIVLESDGSSHDRYNSRIVSYNFKKADYNSIIVFLSNLTWSEILDNDDVNLATQPFSNVMTYAIDQYVPKRIIQPSKQAPWQTAELIRLKSSKRTALKKYSKNGGLVFRQNYMQINKVYKKTAKRCYSNYLRNVQRRLKSDPKSFWKHVNELRKESDLPSTMFYEQQTGSCTQEISDMFRKKFSSVFSRETLSPYQISQAALNVPISSQSLNLINIDIDTVLTAIVKLKPSHSPGPDGIPAVVLKRCSSAIVTPLCQLFQLSLTTGVFPVMWKSSYMFPVHKKGDKKNIDNYRGITALSAIPKLFELVVLKPIFDHCKQYIAETQHGFMPKRSTATNLLSFTTYIMDAMSNGFQTDAIYTDLSAASDKINHAITIAKLDSDFNSEITQDMNNTIDTPYNYDDADDKNPYNSSINGSGNSGDDKNSYNTSINDKKISENITIDTNNITNMNTPTSEVVKTVFNTINNNFMEIINLSDITSNLNYNHIIYGSSPKAFSNFK